MPNDKKDGTGESPKRPHATLDLKATDVTPPAEAKAAAASASEPKPGEAKADAKAAASATASSGKPSDGKPGESKPSDVKTDAKAGDGKLPPGGKPAAAAPPPPRSSSGGRLVSHLLAGIAGGVLAVGVAEWAAPQFGIATQSTALQKRADELQRRLAAVEQAAGTELGTKLKANEDRLAKLEGEAAAIVSSQAKLVDDGKALADKVSSEKLSEAAQQRMTALEDRLATIAKAAESDKGVPQITALTAKIADLQTSLATQVGTLRANVQSDVENRTQLIGEKAEQASSAAQRLDKDLSDAKTELARQAQRLEVLKAGADKVAASQRVLQEEAAKLTSGFEEVKNAVASQVKGGVGEAVSPLTSRLTALEQEIGRVTKSEGDRRQNAERVVVSLELANLKRQIESGQGFADGLEQVRKASSAKLNLSALERFKDSGAPTIADLQRDFRPVANAVLDAATTPAEGGVFDKLVAGAKSVVRVRNLNPSPDDKSVDAVISRMQEALSLGRLGDVLTFAKDIPAAAAAPAQDWLAKVEARHAVDRAIGDIETQLKTSLTAADAGPAVAAPQPFVAPPAMTPPVNGPPVSRMPAPGSAYGSSYSSQ